MLSQYLVVCLFCVSVLAGEDFYHLLGIGRDADDKAIRRAFKKLALKYHPDKNKLHCYPFYHLLGIGRDADDKAIRRAFKKLALKYHPDKNKGDDDAHDYFIKLNRAYEVLKDEEARKKYDMYGEEGLSDQQGGQNYQSWNFYNEKFGIYDEDPEIVTLSRSDFDQSVVNSEDIWFVNFYSTFCSHCHDLAPTWRQMARELEGLIRFGAVNCQEDMMLCQEQGVFGYPSLVIYPEKFKFAGARTLDVLTKFVLNKAQVTVPKLTPKTFDDISSFTGKPWFINFCDANEHCLSEISQLKVASMLKGLVNVATVDCAKHEKLCERLGVESGTAFFEGSLEKDSMKQTFDSLDAKELTYAVLELLPDMQELSDDMLDGLIDKIALDEESPWLVQFVGGEGTRDIELRKLPAHIPELNIGRLNCSKYTEMCGRFFIHKFPTFAVFKLTGGYEIHHGRLTAQDIAGFARFAVQNNVRAMGPLDMEGVQRDKEATWFVDFFTPWCPPCMRLLPEFRKAAKLLHNANIDFGTVDCTIHGTLCQQLNIQSYPTTVLYNGTVPHSFVGLHSASELVDFVEDIRHPPVIEVTPELFNKEVTDSDNIWVIDFFAPWCGPCMQMAPEWRKLAKMMRDIEDVRVGQIDCQQHSDFCSKQAVSAYPTLRLYPKNGGHYVDYRNWFRDAGNLQMWVYQYIPSEVQEITAADYFDLLESSDPWVVDFFAPWCGHCQIFAPEFDKVSRLMKDSGVHFAKVNCDNDFHACQSAMVQAYPSLRFYPGKIGTTPQDAHGLNIYTQVAGEIVNFVETELRKRNKWMKHEHDEF